MPQARVSHDHEDAEMNLGPTEMMIILVIMLLLFGGSQLPKLARSIGQAQKEFKDAMD